MPEEEKNEKTPSAAAAETLREAESGSFEVKVSGRTTEDDSEEDSKTPSVSFAAKLPMIICGLALAALPLIFSALTVLYPFHLAANGIGKIVEFFSVIKDKIVHVFTGEYLETGEVPEELNEQLSEVNIVAGIEDSDGKFIATRKIIRFTGSEYIVAATDGSEYHVKAPATGSSGMKVQFTHSDGTVSTYTPDQFAAALETDDELYVAFDKAVGGDSLFFYDRSGEDTFSDLGINRDPYHNYDAKIKAVEENPTEEQKAKLDDGLTAEQVAFEELYADAIDYDPNSSSTSSGGVGDADDGDPSDGSSDSDGSDGDSWDDEDFDAGFGGDGGGSGDAGTVSEGSSPSEETLAAARTVAEKYIEAVAAGTKADTEEEATKKAAALLNAAISANEPYQAARASAAVLIAAEQAKAGSGGPINEMATLMTSDYAAVPDDEENPAAEKSSASDSDNLSAIVTDIDFSAESAKDYSRDRVSVGDSVKDEGKEVTVSVTSGFKRFLSWIVGLFSGGAKANATTLKAAYTDDIAKALYMKASTLMKGKNLGERITEGLSFLNTNLTKNAGGTNASGEDAVAVYNSYTKKLYDRRVAAERATKSPFDLSSPNTFFGSIVNNIYAIGISDSSTFGKFAKLGSLASKSFGNLMLGAYADNTTSTYLGTSGTCPTVGAIDALGDIYCNQKATYDVKDYESGKNIITATLADYSEGGVLNSKIKDNFKNGDVKSGEIIDNSDAADYITLNAGRGSTPGVKDANVCEAKNRSTGIGGIFDFLFPSASRVSSSCSGDGEKYATGEIFANTDDNKENWNGTYRYIQGYYLEVYALELTGYYNQKNSDGTPRNNPIAAYKEEYYKKNPKDNSFEGTLAYRTGWSKEEIIAGIDAINYLAYLKSYDSTSRLAFFEKPEEAKISIEETPTPTDVRLADNKKIVFDEQRNRVVLI